MDRILFAEDDKRLRETFCDYFTAKGFSVTLAENGEKAAAIAAEEAFDLIVLDVMMPVMNGLEACRELRRFCDTPVLFLSALGEETDLLRGYGAGADDYVVKPYSLPVLAEKCRAIILRTRGAGPNGLLTAAEITLSPEKMTVTVNGESVPLTTKECRLLTCFMQNKNIVLSRERLLSAVWGFGYEGETRVVDAQVKLLRKKLGDAAGALQTVVGAGYVFREAENK